MFYVYLSPFCLMTYLSYGVYTVRSQKNNHAESCKGQGKMQLSLLVYIVVT